MTTPTLDDFIATALLQPAELLSAFTLADVERFASLDYGTVKWAYNRISISPEGVVHAA